MMPVDDEFHEAFGAMIHRGKVEAMSIEWSAADLPKKDERDFSTPAEPYREIERLRATIEEQGAEVGRLIYEIQAHVNTLGQKEAIFAGLVKERKLAEDETAIVRAELSAEIKRLREALEPFAWSGFYHPAYSKDDLARARAAYTAKEMQESKFQLDEETTIKLLGKVAKLHKALSHEKDVAETARRISERSSKEKEALRAELATLRDLLLEARGYAPFDLDVRIDAALAKGGGDG